MAGPNLNKVPFDIAKMFDGVARRYDIVNDILSLGQTKAWRGAVVGSIEPKAGMLILDLAAGTGSSTAPLVSAGATAIPVDFSLGMLKAGRKRHPNLPFMAGDALALPFSDNSFDLTTISFGLRNVADPKAALVEALRVTAPGGSLVVCEFSHPTFAPFRALYLKYLMRLPNAPPPTQRHIYIWPNRSRLGPIRLRSPLKLVQPAGARHHGKT
jgi:demethylmenaquinone methyltransferase/2-methoxy-6-polyprenyl-1,4-benzoquinol methylase